MSSSPFITPHLLSLPSPSPRKEVPLPQSSYGKVLMEESSCPHLGKKKKTTFKAEHTYSKEKKMKYAQDSYNFSTTLSERNEVQWNLLIEKIMNFNEDLYGHSFYLVHK